MQQVLQEGAQFRRLEWFSQKCYPESFGYSGGIVSITDDDDGREILCGLCSLELR
jgi:hypothetical protein